MKWCNCAMSNMTHPLLWLQILYNIVWTIEHGLLYFVCIKLKFRRTLNSVHLLEYFAFMWTIWWLAQYGKTIHHKIYIHENLLSSIRPTIIFVANYRIMHFKKLLCIKIELGNSHLQARGWIALLFFFKNEIYRFWERMPHRFLYA